MTNIKQIIDKIIKLSENNPYPHGKGGKYQDDKFIACYTEHEEFIEITISRFPSKEEIDIGKNMPKYKRRFTLIVDKGDWIKEFEEL